MTRSTKPIRITIDFDTIDEASYAFMFLDRCSFTEFLDRTEPHLGKIACTERAYKMRDAVHRIEKAFEQAEIPRRIY